MQRHELIQLLRKVCAELYDDVNSARLIAFDTGLTLTRINFQGTAEVIWQDLLEAALHQQRLPALLQVVQRDFPTNDQVVAAVMAYERWRTIDQPTRAANPQRNPFQYLLPVAPETFVGRRLLVRQMAIDLTVDKGDSHALIAGRRCGKSSLLMALGEQLRQQPVQTGEGDWLALPLYFDFKAAAFPSVEAFFARILADLCRRVDSNARRRPADAWPTPVRLEAGWFTTLAAQPELTLRDFEDAVGYLLEQVATSQAGVRLVLLLDEVDETLDEAWTYALFNQLRALIYSGDLRSQVRLVLAGSRRFLDQVSDRGSPLWNVLKLHYLTVFEQAGFGELTAQWPGLPTAIAEEVWTQSGGHPFLAQYLYHHLWAGEPAAGLETQAVAHLVEKFFAEQAQDLVGWMNGIEAAGLIVYAALREAEEWVTEEAVGAQCHQPAQLTKRGLTALCYHGLVVHEQWARYRRSGQLFSTWVERYALGILETNRAMTPAAAETIV